MQRWIENSVIGIFAEAPKAEVTMSETPEGRRFPTEPPEIDLTQMSKSEYLKQFRFMSRRYIEAGLLWEQANYNKRLLESLTADDAGAPDPTPS